MSVVNARGFGRGRARQARYRIVEDVLEYILRVKLEIVCRDELVEEVVAVIEAEGFSHLHVPRRKKQ